MNISRKKFVILFMISGFAFLFITTSLLISTSGPRGFPKPPDSLLGLDSPIAWKRTVSTIIVPVKIVLIGPLLLPQINFLKEDPPPPFVGIYFIFYWTILASIIHYLLGKFNVPINPMNIFRLTCAILAILFGAFLFVYGERDDSPGGQVIGFVIIIVGIVGVVRSMKKISSKL